MCQQFQTDIYFLIQRPISTFLIKYYGYKGDTQIVLIKGVNATDMMEETEVEAKPETQSYIHILLTFRYLGIISKITELPSHNKNKQRVCICF